MSRVVLNVIVVCSLFAVSFMNGNNFTYPIVGAYFPNWAQYRASPYTFTPSSMSPIMTDVNVVWYGFAYFCPDTSWVQPYWVTQLGLCRGKQPFDVIPIESKDTQFYSQITQYRNTNRNLKVLISIGGWNFPSNFFSRMVASSSARAHFISSVKSFMQQYRFDGVDIDWEYPNSPARNDEVKITCYEFYETRDEGGTSADGANLLQLVKEMRSSFGSEYLITIAAQADMQKANDQKIQEMSRYIDLYNLMSYDYSVSDIAGTGAGLTAPNEPLYPPVETGIQHDSVASTIDGYISAGVSPAKMAVGIAYYGHLWYVPGLSGDAWQHFQLTAQVQGQCCGPFASTYGAKFGKYSQLCGTYMYSEILDAAFETYFDNDTQSNIGYSLSPTDGYTSAGVWVSYPGPESITSIIDYAKKRRLSGAFAFDISMDTLSGNTFTYRLTKQIANEVRG